ncbi:MAG: putative cobaltochelatase [Methanocellales archaeon]|nr:putative cobaltochelatase [Methanocellales archaeon]
MEGKDGKIIEVRQVTHHVRRKILPFAAIVEQEKMKHALILNTINPSIGGVLIRGEKGTAKSTAVRALAELLPEIEVVSGCPFNCNPLDKNEMCDVCYAKKENGEKMDVMRRRVRVIDLPLGATEDRVVGMLDVEKAIKKGIKALEPGILAEVNRGILYIDEVNLLDDHVADVLLDAAAMGINTVEREGISVSHPSKFILIGTMNPEEGELRPQLLDRFGLQVSVESIDDPDKRVEIVKVVDDFECDSEGFKKKFEREQNALRERITNAKFILKDVTIDDDLLRVVADTCIKLGVKTHRAEIVIVRTAKTIAAFNGRKKVTREDVKEAMELALPHRMRRKPFEPPHLDMDRLDEVMSNAQDKKQGREEREQKGEKREHHHAEKGERDTRGSEYEGEQDSSTSKAREFVFEVGSPIDVSKLKTAQKKDKTYRRKTHGRRIDTLSLRNSGRYVRATLPRGGRKDIALDATIRAAAPYQKERINKNRAIVIHSEDIREKIRVGKASAVCVFVVDASGSMGATGRMESAKGAILSLLLDSYQQRDKIGMVAFKGDGADILLPLCSSVDLALERLRELPTGGRTPLSAGLEKGMNVLLNEKRKDNEVIPMMVLISDGRANVPLGGGGIREEIMGIAEQIRSNSIHTVIIDTEVVGKSFMNLQLGYCKDIADHSGGRYYPITHLTPENVHDIAARERELLVN